MSDLIKKIFGIYVDEEDRKVLEAVNNSGLKSMKVVGRGTLMVDPLEVSSSDTFKSHADRIKKSIEVNS